MSDTLTAPAPPPIDLNSVLARTDQPVVFKSQVSLSARYNFVADGGIAFVRSTVETPFAGVWFTDKDDDLLPNGDPHYGGWLMDWAKLGGYHCWYDNKLNVDIFKIGFRGDQLGRFALGADPLTPNVQFQVHDLNIPAITQTISLWSNLHGIRLNSKARDSDAISVVRDATQNQRHINLHQGDGSHDWRIAMGKDTYDLVMCNGQGDPLCSASNPGVPVFTLKGDGTLVNKTISELEARIAALEKLLPQKAAPAPSTAQ